MPLVLTVDLECWAQKTHRRVTGAVRPVGGDVLERQTDLWLDLLARHGVRATFFVLGMTAAAWPELVRRVARAGHEIAAHGWDHTRATDQSPEELRADVLRCIDAVEAASGAVVRGYRAPEFSVTRRSLWALDVLADVGLTYDASVFPIVHRRYGIPGWPPHPTRVAGGRMVELPAATVGVGLARLPVAGGGYWRVLPERVIRAALERLARGPHPALLYFHPVEMGPSPPPLGPGLAGVDRLRAEWIRAAQSPGLARVAGLLEGVLPRFAWITAGEAAARY